MSSKEYPASVTVKVGEKAGRLHLCHKASAFQVEPVTACFPLLDVRVHPRVLLPPLPAGLPYCLITLFKYRFLSS